MSAQTGGELLTYLIHGDGRNLHRERGSRCIVCEEDCSRDALIKLAYVFETCDCGHPDYQHLIETLAHRDCLAKEATP